MLKSKKIVDWLYDYSLYFIIGALLLVIIAIEPSFVRVSNFTTILTQSATKIIYACGIAGIIVLGGTDLALGREVGLAAVVAASLLQAVDYSQRVFSADQVPALPLIVPLLLVMVLLGIICAAHPLHHAGSGRRQARLPDHERPRRPDEPPDGLRRRRRRYRCRHGHSGHGRR